MNYRESIYIIIILGLSFFVWKGCSTNNHTFERIYNESQDSLKVTRNKLNQEIASTNILHGTIKDLQNIHSSDSSEIGKLQKLVNKNTLSASVLSNATHGGFTIAQQTILIHDTVTIDGVKYIFPEYRDSIFNRWELFNIIANKDSVRLDYVVFNEFELKQEWKRNGPFKRKTAQASITNLNPHTQTLEYKTFTVKENKGNRILDILIGAAAAAILVEGFHVFNIQIPIHF